MTKFKTWLHRQPSFLIPTLLYVAGLPVLGLLALQTGNAGGLIILYAILGRLVAEFLKPRPTI